MQDTDDNTNTRLTHVRDNGVEFKYKVTVDNDRIVLNARTDKHEYVTAFDAKTFLPVHSKINGVDDRGDEFKFHITEWDIKPMQADSTSRVTKGEPVLRHTMTKNTFSPRNVGGETDFPKDTYGHTFRDDYAMLEKGLEALNPSPLKNELQRRFGATAAEIGFGDYRAHAAALSPS